MTKQLFSFHTNERLLEALFQAQVQFLVVGGLAAHFHEPERVPNDLDLVVAPTVEGGRRLLVALDAIGVPGHFTPEDYAARAQAGFPLKGEFYAEILKAEPWFNFTEHWNEAHDALVFNT